MAKSTRSACTSTGLFVMALLAGAFAPAAALGADMSEAQMITSAESAAPAAIAQDATVVAMGHDGKMTVLRQGTNGFTCMPDNPRSPGNDPMCLDANGMEWGQAWMTKGQPPAGKIGFGYMLQGGSDASNTDPHASGPAGGAGWVDTGPHVMILNAGGAMAGYPRQGENPDTSQPYVMWPGTPYEHLMIPVK